MPLTDHSSLIRMSVEGTIYGSQVVNVFHFQHYKNLIVTTPTSQDLADFLNYMDTNGRSKYLQPLSHDYTITKYTARTLVEPAIAVELVPLTGTLIGTQPSEGEANQVAGIVTWRTAFAGRRYRGRTYLPAMPESEIMPAFSHPQSWVGSQPGLTGGGRLLGWAKIHSPIARTFVSCLTRMVYFLAQLHRRASAYPHSTL